MSSLVVSPRLGLILKPTPDLSFYASYSRSYLPSSGDQFASLDLTGEALKPEFKDYAKAVIANAKTLAGRLKDRGADLVAGGTDTHLALVDLRPLGITGKDADEALERASITCNKNGVPFDPLPPVKTSGIRVGSPAGTTRGFGVAEFRDIADMVADVLEGVRVNGEAGDAAVEAAVKARVRDLCARFPIYQDF